VVAEIARLRPFLTGDANEVRLTQIIEDAS
jgi:hypothetical protein